MTNPWSPKQIVRQSRQIYVEPPTICPIFQQTAAWLTVLHIEYFWRNKNTLAFYPIYLPWNGTDSQNNSGVQLSYITNAIADHDLPTQGASELATMALT